MSSTLTKNNTPYNPFNMVKPEDLIGYTAPVTGNTQTNFNKYTIKNPAINPQSNSTNTNTNTGNNSLNLINNDSLLGLSRASNSIESLNSQSIFNGGLDMRDFGINGTKLVYDGKGGYTGTLDGDKWKKALEDQKTFGDKYGSTIGAVGSIVGLGLSGLGYLDNHKFMDLQMKGLKENIAIAQDENAATKKFRDAYAV